MAPAVPRYYFYLLQAVLHPFHPLQRLHQNFGEALVLDSHIRHSMFQPDRLSFFQALLYLKGFNLL